MVLKILIPALIGIAFIGAGGIQKTSDFIKGITSSTPKESSKPSGVSSIPDVPNPSSNAVDIPNATKPITVPLAETINQQNTQRLLELLASSQSQSDALLKIANNSITAQNVSSLPNVQQSQGQKLIESSVVLTNPQLTANTSLAGAIKTTGEQIKREEPVIITNAKNTTTSSSSKLQQAVAKEQTKAEELFAKLYGNVNNPNFAQGKPSK